jgi:murein L,D-transpeptidase YafK
MAKVFVLLLALLPALAAGAPPAEGSLADRVVIDKSEHSLTLYAGERRLASFRVALGRQPVGAKLCRGDDRTPEGRYYVSGRKENSDFHRALRLSYPSDFDRLRAFEAGCEPGGDIMIHGLKEDWGRDSRYHRRIDWTKGCIAVTNEEIEQIWSMVPDGVAVEIRP